MAGDGRGACLGAGAGPAGVGTARGVLGHATPVGCQAVLCHRGKLQRQHAQGLPMRWLQGVGQAVICSPWCGVLAGPGAGPLAGDGRGAFMGAGAGPAGEGTARGVRGHAMPVCCEALGCHLGASRQASATSCHTGQGRHMIWLQGVGQAVIRSPWCGVLAGPGAGPLAGDGRGACLGAGAGPAGVGTARGQRCQSAARRSCATLGPLRQASATSCHTGQGRHMRWLQGVGQAVICSPWWGVLAGPGAGPLAGDGRGACLGAGAGPAGVGTARDQRCQSAARRSCATLGPLRQASATSCHTGQGRHMRWLQGVGQAVICSPWWGVLAGPGAGPLAGDGRGACLGAGAGPADEGTARGLRGHATPVGCQAVLCHRGKLQRQHAQGLPMRWLQGVGQAVICSPWCGVLAGPGAGPLAGDGRGACLGAGAGPAGVGTARGQQCQSAARRSCATLGPLRQASATSCHTGQGRHMRWLQGVDQAVICSPWAGWGEFASAGAGPVFVGTGFVSLCRVSGLIVLQEYSIPCTEGFTVQSI